MALPLDFSTYSFDPLYVNGFLGLFVNVAKHSKRPWLRWINDSTKRFVHAMIAAVTAAGMSLSYATADDGSWTITLSGITLAGIASFLFTVLKNLGTQGIVSTAADGLRLLVEVNERLKRQEAADGRRS